MAGNTLLRHGSIVIVLAAWALPAAGQPLPAGKPLSLGEAVRISLEQAPVIRSASEGVAVQRGAVREARGAFDALLRLAPVYTHAADDIGSTLASSTLFVPDQRLSTNSFSVAVSLEKPFRTGTTVRFDASLSGGDSQFTPPLPVVGGDLPGMFVDRFQAYWVQPLLRGRGAVTVQATERSAASTLEASQFEFQQTNADQVLATADRYLTLVAARESLALTRQSLENQRALLESTVRLVAAGEVPRGDVTRARARTLEGEANVQLALRAVLSAQWALADVLGLPPDALTTLAASDAFPPEPLALDLDGLSKEAVARRADVKARSASFEAERILQAAAAADLRPRLDLTISGGATQSHYGSGAGFPAPDSSPWGAVALVSCTFELPFGNNQRAGSYVQATSSMHQSEIRLADLGRRVQNTVAQYAEDVRRTRVEWAQRQEAVMRYEATWDAALRLRAAGEMSLIDTLLTEQQLMQARLRLVEARRAYATALARFKRETGTLMNFADWAHGQPDLAGLVAPR
jgi:outer membrane protein TolC